MIERSPHIADLIAAHVDGVLGRAESQTLAEAIERDSAIAGALVDAMRLEATIGSHYRSRRGEATASHREIPAVHVVRRVDRRATAWAMAAALALAGAAAAIYLLGYSESARDEASPQAASDPIATILDASPEATLLIDDRIAAPGSDFASGAVSLDAGTAEFRLVNGVGVVLSGQTQLDVRNPMTATMSRGRAWFECPPGASGYTVTVPGGMRIVDLGTEFVVDVGEDGQTLVHVYAGRVELQVDGMVVGLSAAESRRFDPSTRALTAVDDAAERFVDQRPYELTLVNGEFEASDLRGWGVSVTPEQSSTGTVIVPGDDAVERDRAPEGVGAGGAVRMGFKYQGVTLRQTTDHGLIREGQYTIAVRARADDTDHGPPFGQLLIVSIGTGGRGSVVRPVRLDGSWRWHVVHVRGEALKGAAGENVEVRLVKSSDKEGDFVWIDSVRLWRGRVTAEELENGEY